MSLPQNIFPIFTASFSISLQGTTLCIKSLESVEASGKAKKKIYGRSPLQPVSAHSVSGLTPCRQFSTTEPTRLQGKFESNSESLQPERHQQFVGLSPTDYLQLPFWCFPKPHEQACYIILPRHNLSSWLYLLVFINSLTLADDYFAFYSYLLFR